MKAKCLGKRGGVKAECRERVAVDGEMSGRSPIDGGLSGKSSVDVDFYREWTLTPGSVERGDEGMVLGAMLHACVSMPSWRFPLSSRESVNMFLEKKRSRPTNTSTKRKRVDHTPLSPRGARGARYSLRPGARRLLYSMLTQARVNQKLFQKVQNLRQCRCFMTSIAPLAPLGRGLGVRGKVCGTTMGSSAAFPEQVIRRIVLQSIGCVLN